MEWYLVDKCDYQRMRPVAGLKRWSEHRGKENWVLGFGGCALRNLVWLMPGGALRE